MNIANGSTIQILLPEAAHPKQTGNEPIIAPTNVLSQDCCFIFVQMNRQLPQMVAPIPAVKGLYAIIPAKPAAPSPIPKPRAIFGLTPLTRGLCEVLSIFLSSQTSMYWFKAWVDMESATDEAKRGRQENVAGQREQAPIVTIPFSSDSLNLVSSRPCLNTLLQVLVENASLFAKVNIINIELISFNRDISLTSLCLININKLIIIFHQENQFKLSFCNILKFTM